MRFSVKREIAEKNEKLRINKIHEWKLKKTPVHCKEVFTLETLFFPAFAGHMTYTDCGQRREQIVFWVFFKITAILDSNQRINAALHQDLRAVMRERGFRRPRQRLTLEIMGNSQSEPSTGERETSAKAVTVR